MEIRRPLAPFMDVGIDPILRTSQLRINPGQLSDINNTLFGCPALDIALNCRGEFAAGVDIEAMQPDKPGAARGLGFFEQLSQAHADPFGMADQASAGRVLGAVFCGHIVRGMVGPDATPQQTVEWLMTVGSPEKRTEGSQA